MQEYWLKQTQETPLFPDILWARPENKRSAGKLLIVGGSAHGFVAVGEAFAEATKAGAGSLMAVMPDALRKSVGPLLEAEFVPSTPSGSFASQALGELLPHTAWADAVLLAGDIGRNSETAALLEQFVLKYQGPLVVTKDVTDYFYAQPKLLAERQHTVIVLSLAQLQKLGTALKFETPFLLSMGLMLLVQALHSFTKIYPVIVVVKELENIVVAHKGNVSSTKLNEDKEIWRVATAAKASVFWMQNPGKTFQSVTASMVI
jgi:NAD(P)H-hydrate repair Nnr-like enzyme with NAD(P)H-hydrate dehydratase domain